MIGRIIEQNSTHVLHPVLRIRSLYDLWIRYPGWVKLRSRIRDPDPGRTTRIIFPRARNDFLG